MSDFLGYLDRISKGAPRAELARIAGVSASTVTRWDTTRADHIQPKAEHVIPLARRYGAHPIEALIAADIVTAADVRAREVQAPITDYSDSALLRELERRLAARPSHAHGIITSPADYGEEPSPRDYELAAGDIARDPDAD